MNQMRRFPSVFLCLFCLGFRANPCAAADAVLRVGASRIEITPEMPVLLAGYASRKELSHGVHDPISARAAAFEQGGKHLVLVSTDILGFYNGTAAVLRQAILDECHLQPSELFLAAIHTHSAPTPVLDPTKGHSNNVAYTQSLQTKLVRVVREALDRVAPANLEFGSGASPVGASRRQLIADAAGNPKVVLGRNPEVMIDREVQVLKVARTGSGDLLALLFAYNTHSTSLGPANYLVSGDVHGLAEQFTEKYLGNDVVVPGFAAPSGNIDPWYRVLPEFRTTNGWIPEPVLLGTLLGEEVVRTLEGMKPDELTGPLVTSFETLELPGKPTGVTRITNNCPPTPLNLTVGRVGQVAFVGIGGEVFNEIGKAIKTASPFPRTMVITHCNGAAGYLPIRRAYLEGGYEVESSPFAPSAADRVIHEALRMLNAL